MDYSKAEVFFKSNSKFQEKYAEYYFLQQILLQAACMNSKVDIARADVDAFGYDIMLSLNEQTLFIQLKSYSGAANYWDVHKSMLLKHDGRIILTKLKRDAKLNSLAVRFFCFNPDNCCAALLRLPKVKHPGKCKTLKADYNLDITDNLLSIFDVRGI